MVALPPETGALIDALPDGVLVADPAGRIVFVNSRLEELSGFRQRDLLGSPVELLVPLDKRVKHEGHRGEFQESPIVRPMGTGPDIHLRHRSGSDIPVDIQLSAVDLQGRLFSVASIRDVAQRNAAEVAHRHSERRYRTLLEMVPAMVSTLSPEGVITSLNREFEDITGARREDWVGKHFSDLIDPRDVAMGLERFRRLLAGDTMEVREVRIRAASGMPRILESVAVQLTDDEDLVEVLALSRDVTELRGAELALRQSEERFRRIFEDSAAGIVLIDADLRIVDINPAITEMFGYSRDEVLDQSVLEFVRPEDAGDIQRTGKDFLLERIQSRQNERLLTTKAGRTLVTHVTSSIVRDDEGRPLVGLVLLLDVTEQRLLEEEISHLADLARESLNALTPRERETLDLLAEGETTADIARRLVVSVRTIESHLANAYRKLGVHCREDAAVRYRNLTSAQNCSPTVPPSA